MENDRAINGKLVISEKDDSGFNIWKVFLNGVGDTEVTYRNLQTCTVIRKIR